MKKWLPEGLKIFRVTQHNMSNPMIELDGERARSRTYGHLIHFQEKKTGGFTPMRHHTIYHDEWVKQASGWRIATRRLAHLHIDGVITPPDDSKHYREPKPIGLVISQREESCMELGKLAIWTSVGLGLSPAIEAAQSGPRPRRSGIRWRCAAISS
jgi:hypothetical protein